MKLYQQGDVLIESVESIPEGLKRKKDFVLADGEVTGHKHQIDLKDVEADMIEVYEGKDGMLFVRAKQDVKVKHEEHKEITIPKGIWRVRKVKEYDHMLEESREVRD